MTTYKYTSPDNTVVHVIDDDGVSRSSCLASALPVDAVIEPADAPPPPTIRDQIRALEDTITNRRVREAILKTDGGWLEDVEAQIALLRAQLP